jgi:predicted PhzF superfamily epimerase YddE/YHI9
MIVYHVDAFTRHPFGGNPAAVCLLPEPADDDWMASLAAELNLPKTVFALREGAGDVFRLRWFGPDGESPLCGHGTLAAAHVLWECGQARPGRTIRFLTSSGELEARQLRAGWIELDFPSEPASQVEKSGLAEALGAVPQWIGRNRLDYLVEVADERAVRSLQPDFARLAALLPPLRGVIVTSPGAAESACDFVSRRFAPTIGLNEDAVTGSAHCALGPHWAARTGKQDFLARQLSARGGTLRVHVEEERVRIAGQAVTLLRGQLLAPRTAQSGRSLLTVAQPV